MCGGGLHQPLLLTPLPKKHTALRSLTSNAIQRLCQVKAGVLSEQNSGHSGLKRKIRVDCNYVKWQKEGAIGKAVITAITPPPHVFLAEHLRGSCYDEQLSRLPFNRQGHFLSNCCCWFPLCPKSRSQNYSAQVATPLLPHSFDFHEVTPPLFSYQPMQSTILTSLIFLFCFVFFNSEIHERLSIQLFFMRGNTEIIGLPCNGLRVGGGLMAVKKAEAPMNYSGWHLAAAVPRARRAVPGPVTVGTSGAHGEAGHTSQPLTPWESGPPPQKKRPSVARVDPSGLFASCSGFTKDEQCSPLLILKDCSFYSFLYSYVICLPGHGPLPLWAQFFSSL